CLKNSVADVVRRQAQIGIDVVSDGEYGKSISWNQYIIERMSGFALRPNPPGPGGRAGDPGLDRKRFKEFYAELDARDPPANPETVICVGPVAYTGQSELARDIENFKTALAAAQVVEGFLPVVAPASVLPERKDEYYGSEDDWMHAITEAMRSEYKMIVNAGLILQIDDARAATYYDRMVPPASMQDYRRWLEKFIESLNWALAGIPEDRV